MTNILETPFLSQVYLSLDNSLLLDALLQVVNADANKQTNKGNEQNKPT